MNKYTGQRICKEEKKTPLHNNWRQKNTILQELKNIIDLGWYCHPLWCWDGPLRHKSIWLLVSASVSSLWKEKSNSHRPTKSQGPGCRLPWGTSETIKIVLLLVVKWIARGLFLKTVLNDKLLHVTKGKITGLELSRPLSLTLTLSLASFVTLDESCNLFELLLHPL